MSSKYKIGIIGGTGFTNSLILKRGKSSTVSTPYGKVKVFEEGNIVFLHRHGEKYFAPHHINYRANIMALKKKGVKYILATAACGSLNWGIKPCDLVLLSDFIDFTKSRIQTFNPEGKPKYIDMSEPYSGFLRGKIKQTAAALRLKLHDRAIYACTEGPRFETKAEITAFRTLKCDVVGMTQMPEVVLAAEAGIPYAAVGIVTNFAAGISKKKISSEEVVVMMRKKAPELAKLLLEVCRRL
jgi:5'-methylthioadenosine phosphorylase